MVLNTLCTALYISSKAIETTILTTMSFVIMPYKMECNYNYYYIDLYVCSAEAVSQSVTFFYKILQPISVCLKIITNIHLLFAAPCISTSKQKP